MATHEFNPTHFHPTIGTYQTVLRIGDGDTVRTSTLCAHGYDGSGERRSDCSNPMTGPFFVEGAMPGDALEVTFDSITPNREYGWSRTTLAANVLDPDSDTLRRSAETDSDQLASWRVDNEAGTVTLVDPAATRLGGISLPLEPMLGCFGVAPELGQAIATATSGRHGGNMDYRGFGVGVSALLPVFVPGALFHLGDCHARQGDGEIGGTGVEISADVQFTVRVRKNAGLRWPAGESRDHTFTVGNARPLDQALQHATTEMQRRLQQEYGLDRVAAALLMGQCIEYDVGNVYDPAYTVVCKLAKDLLAAL